jgi:hypothetical protein
MENSLGIAPGKKIRIFEAYLEAREAAANGELDAEEAMSTSDFPTYISKFIRHTFLERFREISGKWPAYTRDFSLEDFEDYSSSRFGRFTDIPERSPNAEYDELAISEYPGEVLRLREWGAAFGLTRRLIISDHLNKLTDLPRQLADALARTQSKEAAVNQFQANPTMFDGNALISAGHSNIQTTALTANVAGMNELIAAETKLEAQTDQEGYQIVVTPGSDGSLESPGLWLIIPTELKWVAQALNANELIPNASNQLEANQVRGRYNILIEPYLTDANNWYLSVDPKSELGFLASVTLNGNNTPFLGLKDPGVRGVLGGDDPYSFEFDEIKYKIRHDFAFKPIEWRGIVGAIVP